MFKFSVSVHNIYHTTHIQSAELCYRTDKEEAQCTRALRLQREAIALRIAALCASTIRDITHLTSKHQSAF